VWGRRRPNFVAGEYIAFVSEELDLMLSAVPYNPDNKWVQDTSKVKGDTWERQRKEINVQ
jgi:hypothetical protein